MTVFDSPRWATLQTVYGDARHVPGVLQRLAGGDESVMEDLIQDLCHQGTVKNASYAAIPILADIARDTPGLELRAQILILIGWIVSSTDRAPMPEELAADYHAALPRALELALRTLRELTDSTTAVYLLEAAAALSGRTVLGRELTRFIDEEFLIACPGCTRELYLWPEGVGLTVAAEDPSVVPKTRRTPVVVAPQSLVHPDYRWLLQVGGDAALAEIGERLPSLWGHGTCPACGAAFSIWEQLGKIT
jgi:hypothetical protein